MLWLPALDPSPAGGAFAVADGSAVALENALLESAAAADHLRGALLVDPWFCRWAVGNCGRTATIADLALCLAGRLAGRLAASSYSPLAWTRPDEAAAQSYAAQAASILQASAATLGYGDVAACAPAFFERMLAAPAVHDNAAVMGQYLRLAPGVEWRLPRLVARLAEFQSLADDFDSALEHAKLDAMKELAYGASHEVNNPLANISGRAQALLRDETDSRRRRLLTAIDNQAIRAHEMISDLMLFARPPELAKAPTSVADLLKELKRELEERAAEQHVELELRAPESLTVVLDPTQIKVAVAALLQNALDAIGYDGRVTVDAGIEPDELVIRVADTGPGIAEEVRQHMFDPFYSGREAGRGLGFGLSKCWRIVGQHGGSVAVDRTGPGGSVLALRLPLASEEA